MQLKTAILTAAFLTLIGEPALAGYGSSAEVRGLTFEVVDLDPNDGIESRMWFERSHSFAYMQLNDNLGEYADHEGREVSVPLENAAVAGGNQWAAASSFMAATGRGYSIASQGLLSPGSAAGAYRTSFHLDLVMGVTPRTEVVWRGSYFLSAWAGKDAATEREQKPSASVFWGVLGQGGTWDDLQASSRKSKGPSFLTKSGDFYLQMTNAGDSIGQYNGMLSTSVMGGYVAPVPEPSTYAMMAAGLGLVGFVARRRKSLAK